MRWFSINTGFEIFIHLHLPGFILFFCHLTHPACNYGLLWNVKLLKCNNTTSNNKNVKPKEYQAQNFKPIYQIFNKLCQYIRLQLHNMIITRVSSHECLPHKHLNLIQIITFLITATELLLSCKPQISFCRETLMGINDLVCLCLMLSADITLKSNNWKR